MTYIDENTVNAALVYNATTGLPQTLKVDPSTGYLQMMITNFTGVDVANTILPTDENCTGVAEAVDSNGVIKPLQTDTNGYLRIKLI
jgi:hypothetical protein